MNGGVDLDQDDSEFVEVDPTGRYGRYNEVLGKGSSKTVYRAFDEYEGIEVAWNQVKLNDFLRSREDFERLYCEIHLLKTLKHKNIMKFCTYWVDMANRNLNFVTELFTSGTLRQFRLKHKRVNIRAIKHWCRQILEGLLYLHSHDPPVIHRDLKCDNIFINGNHGEVKIGDLGLAAILQKSRPALCVGTPEFMAPEVYEEEYNELVDIYSFGMCILEMVTFEYPYSECSLPAEIYKKVISGKKPDALYKVKDPEVRGFVEKCLATASDRLSAWELLNDPFLQTDEYTNYLKPLNYQREYDELGPILSQRLLSAQHSTDSSLVNGYSNYLGYEQENDFDCHSVEYEANEIELFADQCDEHLENVGITIRGRRTEDNHIFLRLRIADKEGPARNIHFPFDIETDTALSVAAEMVAELDIKDQAVAKIAEMIDGQIASLVPGWRSGASVEESATQTAGSCTHVLPCCQHGCGATHGRFEEFEEEIEQSVIDGAPMCSSQSNGGYFADIWSQINGGCYADDEERSRRIKSAEDTTETPSPTEDYDDEITQELRWLKAKYQMKIRELRDEQLGVILSRPLNLDTDPLNLHSLHRAASLPVDATDL